MSQGRPDDPVDRAANTPGSPVDAYAGDLLLDHEQRADAYEAHLDELEPELPGFERELVRIEKRERGET